MADLTITKRQEGPATVDPGAKVTYTITVTNDGPLAYTAGDPASITDDLSRVLDDARYNGDARATSGTVRYDNPELFWSGALAPGASATVTFSVTVNARTFGNLKLDNTVVSDIPGSNCPEGSRDALHDPRQGEGQGQGQGREARRGHPQGHGRAHGQGPAGLTTGTDRRAGHRPARPIEFTDVSQKSADNCVHRLGAVLH